jgi:NADPH:quinone reductase-like Zn-dependent oxidoreductase
MTAMAAAAVRADTMKAIVRDRYGSPDVLGLREIEKPELTDEGVLVRVHAVSVNRADWYALGGIVVGRPETGLRKPKSRLIGTDFAGTVEAVGRGVTDVRPGDEVFGAASGAFAEYVCARARSVALKPAHVTFEEAAAVPVAALTALQGLRDKGQIEAGQKVLINGASGGVGTFAVQIAKAFGAEVTAVCSARNVERVRSIGADRVVDYSREDFTRSGQRYDLLFDNAGSKSWSECKRVLGPHATVVLVGGQMGNRVAGPLGHVIRMRLGAVGSGRKAVFFVAKFNKLDMEVLRELLEDGKVKPVVDRSYALSEAADAFRYLGEGHAQGKVVITV